MVTKSLLILLLFFFTNSKLEDGYKCQKIECSDSLDENTCIKVESTTSFFKECPSGKICDISFDDPILDSKCIENTKKIKRLPSLSCESNDDCLSGDCDEHKCKGKALNEKCNAVAECNYGLTCRKDSDNTYKCLDPITTGNKCQIDTDCVNESGCLNNICTKYFSLENNQLSRDLKDEELNFCKSGYSNELGICQNLTLINEKAECSEFNKCIYNNSFGENITLDNNCLCGYNKDGKQYCLLGSGDKNYTRYIKKLKDYYLLNKNCHASERNAEGCQKDLLYNDSYILNKIHELINAKYWAKSNNKLINAPECAYKVELSNYDRELDKDYEPEPSSGEGKCAVYQCGNSDGEYCSQSIYKNVFNISVILNDICADGVSCKIGGDPNEIFYNRTNVKSKCYSKIENKRYPGEQCEVDTECFYPLNNPSSQFHKCEDGRCNGIDENGICEDNSWCLAGYFCDKHSGKCKEQKPKDEECLDSKECQNNLICLKSKCSEELYSLDDGEKLPENDELEIQKRFCKSGEAYDSKCISYNETDILADNESDYKKCDFGEKCVYEVNGLNYRKIREIDCPCGYNVQGQGYCPKFYDKSNKDWEEYRDILIKNYDNECHTENRYNCYKKKKMEKEKELKNKLEKGHLFYKSVPCAEKLLDGKYLLVKEFFFALWIAFILF